MGEFFALLGPNGGGKTTLFRIVSTLIDATGGTVQVFGIDVRRRPAEVRTRIGVVFQAPAIDRRLTVSENLHHHGRLYGMRAEELSERCSDALATLRLTDRADDIVGTLSGGLQRRAELAKALITRPDLLILDEPTTGLDPATRRDVRDHLMQLRSQGMTIMMTTHLMEEATTCDRVAIIHHGKLVAIDTPAQLVEAVGGDVIVVVAREPRTLASAIRKRFGIAAELVDDRLRIEKRRGHEFVPELVEAFPGEIDAITFGKPTLEDAFVHLTGERLE
jgi:ABC-2 type transport system ATP-binding protein